MSAKSDVYGKTIEYIEREGDHTIHVRFTDDTTLYLSAHGDIYHDGHIVAALLTPDDPQSFKADDAFYDLVNERAWSPPPDA